MARTEARSMRREKSQGGVPRPPSKQRLGAGSAANRLDAVDATAEAEIDRQAAFDDAEAAKDAAAWVRRFETRRTVPNRICPPIGISVATVRGWEQGRLVPQGAARGLLRVIDRVPEAVLALRENITIRNLS